MGELIFDYLNDLVDPFFNPKKRVFIGYLISAFIIAFLAQFVLTRANFRQVSTALFSRKVWFSVSAKADYKIFFFNQALMMGIGPRLISKLALATLIFESLHLLFDGRVILMPEAPGWLIATFFTFVLFLMDDCSKYFVHRAMHRWPVLWAFHRVHHTAETMTPLTVYRTHPVEAVIFSLRGVFVQALAVSVFLYFFGTRAELVTVLGANFILFVFNALGSNLRHSHIWISYGSIFERFLISPAQHQIHHSTSISHRDQNFGAVLAIWDWLGGSLTLAPKNQSVRFGVTGSGETEHSLRGVYLEPFISSASVLIRTFKKEKQNMNKTVSRFRRHPIFTRVSIFLLAISTFSGMGIAEELNIYSHRQPFLIQPFIDAYEEKTGTKVNVVYSSKGLAQRMLAEGARSPADVILTVDIARLFVYADKDLLAQVNSDVLKSNIPANLRDPGNRWFAFSKRARVIAVSKKAKDANAIRRYEDLLDPKWIGRICSRPGSHVYNRALMASMIHAIGVNKAEAWAKGLVQNLARRPQGADRAQVKAIYEGQCDIALINNYYFGKLKYAKKAEHRDWAKSINLIFPNQNDRGTHINISGGGIAKHSKNFKEAQRFMEFLTSFEAQNLYAAINFEYPVNLKVPMPKELASWGTFHEDKMPIILVAELAPEAQRVIDRAGW